MNATDVEGRPTPRPKRSFTVLRHRDFRLLLAGDTISMLGSQVQLTALAWHLFQLIRDPLQLGLLGLVRFFPVLLFGFLGGLIADSRDRRTTLLATQLALCLASSLLAGVTYFGMTTVGHIYALAIVSASLSAISGPSRQSLIPSLIPREEISAAMTINILASQSASVAGPALGGLAIALFGLSTAYLLDTCTFLAVVAALLLMRCQIARTTAVHRGWSAAFDGFRFLRTSRVLLGVMAVDLIAAFFGATTVLMPIFADEIFSAGAQGLGLLLSAPAAGAVVTSALLRFLPPFRRLGAGILISVGVYGACVTGFALADDLRLALILLAIGGGADAVSMALRHALRNLLTPEALRGRVAASHSMFAMGGPRLGEFHSGIAASWIGVGPAVAIGGVATMLTALLAAKMVPAIARYDATTEIPVKRDDRRNPQSRWRVDRDDPAPRPMPRLTRSSRLGMLHLVNDWLYTHRPSSVRRITRGFDGSRGSHDANFNHYAAAPQGGAGCVWAAYVLPSDFTYGPLQLPVRVLYAGNRHALPTAR
ncbi:MAG: MFS transporter [Chloroflexota bacterium]|nr:MFS transporter [Chloroflexota bacterium]